MHDGGRPNFVVPYIGRAPRRTKTASNGSFLIDAWSRADAGAASSSGRKDKLGSISRQGDFYLGSLFTAGAFAVIHYAKIHGTRHRHWLTALLARPTKIAAIALANKLAGMACATMAMNERYRERTGRLDRIR